MNKKRKLIISSVSDCREKNGVVTFMEILRRNYQRFNDHGMELAFANYVDFPQNFEEKSNPSSPQQPESGAIHPSKPSIRTRMKRAIKRWITLRPIGAFLLFLSTLSARGLVTAWKARRHDEEGCTHFYQDFLTAFFGCFIHRASSRRIIILHSGDDALSQLFAHFPGMQGTRYELFIRNTFKWTLERQNSVVVLSQKYATELRKQFPKKQVQCIYNTSPFAGERMLQTDSIDPMRKLRLVAVGTLQYRKGFDLLINALALMPSPQRNNLHVTIVGGGPNHPDLIQLVKQHQLSDIVTLAGESNNVAEFLAKSHAYILTSRDEGLPISLIEACSFGLPIITTPVGSIPEIFDAASCKYIQPSENSIMEALVDLCSGQIDLEVLSQRSRSIFDSKLSHETFLDAYLKLLSSKPAAQT